MSDIIVVTNRKLVTGDFLSRITEICKYSPKAVILREKDLPEKEYLELAGTVKRICDEYKVTFISHTFPFGENIHYPLDMFRKISGMTVGTSVHSAEDAVRAQAMGADYLIAGHVFETDCKKGLPGRGTGFIKEVTENVSIPVYAIGGIDPGNFRSVLNAGAKGICIMSSAMTSQNVGELFSAF
ncbi:MAG: thiamine phosphate synthase [Clostridia bacterium]|nr:thiamine phosphate synthase [Clostridia bacterium]